VPGFTRQQLVAAKAGVVGITSVVAGWFLGRDEGDYAASMLVAAAIFGSMATAYEFLAYWLATWFGGQPELAAPVDSPAAPAPFAPPVPEPPRRPFGWVDAVKVLGVFLGTQMVVWVIAVLAVMDPLSDKDPSLIGTAAVLRAFPVALPLSMITGALAVYALTRRFAHRRAAVIPRFTYALAGAPTRDIAFAGTTGALLALLLVLISLLTPVGKTTDQGLLAQVLAASGIGRIVFGLTAVLLAPPVEEYVFRGVMMGTLMPIGEVGAGVLSGLAFWLLHATEWIHYWPAALGVGAMTVLVTHLRLRTRSIVPGIVAHLCYNGALTAVALLA
jgi:membrane protease YdiL (CAAX protease family)